MIKLRSVLALAAAVLLGAAPAAPPPGPETTAVRRYLDAIQHGAYAQAYALLNTQEQRYFRTSANYASVFTADGLHLERYHLVSARRESGAGVYLAREHVRFVDHAANTERTADASVIYGVLHEGGGWRIKDPSHPWRAFATNASGEDGGVRVSVRKVSFFPRRIEVVLTFANVGDGFVTLLPYGRTILKDAAGNVYHPIETRDWRLTSRTLFEGLRLPAHGQYTGFMNFETPDLGNGNPTYSLTVEPALRDGMDRPFSATVDRIAASS